MFFFAAVILSSCSHFHDKLNISKKQFSGNQLKISGYYYYAKDSVIYSSYFFYNDGTILYGGGGGEWGNTTDNLEKNYFTNKAWLQSNKDRKLSWGVFQIEGSNIKFQKWYPSSGGPLKAYVREGEIINDTTFVINKLYRLKNSEISELKKENETYHFKRFTPKPDSANSFIN